MAKFKCSTCKQVYEDYYPPDDTCLKCKKGTVNIINKNRSTITEYYHQIKTDLTSSRTHL